MLRRTLGLKRNEIIESWRKLHTIISFLLSPSVLLSIRF
jgi:hypothetical protein